MDFYRELEAYRKLDTQINQMNSFIRQLTAQSEKRDGGKANAQNEERVLQLRGTVELLTALRNKLNTLYTPNKNNPKSFRRMTAADVEELKTLYEISTDSVKNCLTTLYPDEKKRNSNAARFLSDTEAMMRRDQQLVEKFRPENGLSLPAATFMAHAETISDPKNNPNMAYKWPGFFEYESLFLTDPGVSHEDALRMYNQKSAEDIRQEYEQKVSGNPHFYEYPRTRNRIDPKIRNTGNVEKINHYLAEDEAKENEADKLTFREKQMLIHHRDASVKVKMIQDSVRPDEVEGKELGEKPEFLRNDAEGVVLDVHLPKFQSSANGCWSCAGAMMAGSRGIVPVTQEDIRNYRPDIGENEIVPERGDLDANYNYDSVKSLTDNADSILQHAPNSMLHTLTISAYSEDNQKDYTLNQYLRNTENLLKKQIMHALRVDRSPVSFLRPGHYITIVGMEGNDVLYKDSNNYEGRTEPPDHTFRAPLKALIKSNFIYERGPRPIEIGWLSDIKLARDEKTIHGVPSEYVYMKEDGSVTQQPKAMREAMGYFDSNPVNRTGILVGRPAEDEDQIFSADRGNVYSSSGVQMTEQVYLPKQLKVDYLKKMAQKRSDDEEAKLNTADRVIFHIKEGKKDPELAEAEFRRRMEVIANQKKAGDEPVIPEREIPEREISEKGIPEKEISEKKIIETKDPEKEDEIDTTSDETKMKQREEQAQKKVQSLKITDRQKRLLKEKKLIAKKERIRAEELKKDYSIPKIAGAAGNLLIKMNRHKHFYLIFANPAYKNVIGHLERVRNLAGKAVNQNGEAHFTDEDARELVKAIDKGANEAKKYLSDKQAEMERDPRRRNDPGNVDIEQPRIDAMLDVYDVLSEMSLSLKARENTKDLLIQDEDRKATVNHFIRELISDRADPERSQELSQKNRLYIPEHIVPGMNLLDSMFGIEPSKKKKLRIVDKNNEVISDSGSYRAIGETAGEGNLSKKDFAALAIAASTTAEAMKEEHKTADPGGRFTAEDNRAYHAGDILQSVVNAGPEGLKDPGPDILKSRGLASKVLLDYQEGNPDTLGKLIANGIKNLNALFTGGRFAGDKETELYMAEMGLRLKAMLDRDPKLMEKAMSYGVTPKMLKALKNRGIAAANGALAARWSSEEYLARGENWGIRERERNYVDLLMNRYLEEERERAVAGGAADGPEEAKYSLKLRTAGNTPALDSISNPGKERELKSRFRAYIRANGYLDYTPKEFMEEVVGSKEKPAVERRNPLMAELAAFEAGQKGKSIAAPEMKHTPGIAEKQKQTAPHKMKRDTTVKKPKGAVMG